VQNLAPYYIYKLPTTDLNVITKTLQTILNNLLKGTVGDGETI
jgi:hypothetical protein